MLKVQRQEELVRLCNTTGLLTVNEAAEILGTSPMTIRRDMEELAKDGRIERVLEHPCGTTVINACGSYVLDLPDETIGGRHGIFRVAEA